MDFWSYLRGEPQPAALKEIQGKVVKEFERKLLQELAEHPLHPFQEEPLPDQEFNCPHCGTTLHRFQPSPEAGPYWRCSDCGEARVPDNAAPHMTTSKALDAMWEMQTEEQQRQVEHWIHVLRPMVKELMDAGLVDGVEPDDGVLRPLPPIYCTDCLAEFTDIPGDSQCPHCGSYTFRL